MCYACLKKKILFQTFMRFNWPATFLDEIQTTISANKKLYKIITWSNLFI